MTFILKVFCDLFLRVRNTWFHSRCEPPKYLKVLHVFLLNLRFHILHLGMFHFQRKSTKDSDFLVVKAEAERLHQWILMLKLVTWNSHQAGGCFQQLKWYKHWSCLRRKGGLGNICFFVLKLTCYSFHSDFSTWIWFRYLTRLMKKKHGEEDDARIQPRRRVDTLYDKWQVDEAQTVATWEQSRPSWFLEGSCLSDHNESRFLMWFYLSKAPCNVDPKTHLWFWWLQVKLGDVASFYCIHKQLCAADLVFDSWTCWWHWTQIAVHKALYYLKIWMSPANSAATSLFPWNKIIMTTT